MAKQLSFVYDIADLYKVELLIPAAFQAACDDPAHPESAVRRLLRERIVGGRLLERVVSDLGRLFDGETPLEGLEPTSEREEAPGQLWAPGELVEGGINHACDDP